MRKHILIVIRSFHAGGAERQAVYLARGLVKLNYRVTIFVFDSSDGGAKTWFDKEGLNIITAGFGSKLLLYKGWNPRRNMVKLKYAFRLIRLVRKITPGVIIPFTVEPNVVFGKYWRYMKASACVWNQRDEGRRFKEINGSTKALRNCSKIIANSLEGKNFLKKFTRQPITVIHNGIQMLSAGKNSRDGNASLTFVMVANLHGSKDHMTLLRAWHYIINENKNKELKLILAGTAGNTAPEIVDYIERHGLANSVSYVGHVKDVYHLLAECDVGILSSSKEGQPNAVLEYMVAGLPVIATTIIGCAECLGEDYPLLFNPGDTAALSQMIQHLIDEPSLRDRLGQRNRERVRSEFGMDKMIAGYVNIIERKVK